MPSKPWDTKSLTAEFEYVNANEDGLSFGYAVTNNTDFDYNISSDSQVSVTIKQTNQPTLTDAAGVVTPKVPFFLPARQKMSLEVHMSISTPFKEPPSHASKEEKDKYKAELKAHMNETPFSEVDGFVMFDPAKRYQVIFPPGWKSK